MKVIETKRGKFINSKNFHMQFSKTDGFMAVWGKTPEDDPQWCPMGPLIADIEISTICHQGCKFCYKGNSTTGTYMSFETFVQVFNQLNTNNTLTQIAFGIGSIDANPDQWKIFNYCRDHGVIPNITINGARMTPEFYDKLANTMGAVAVSWYSDDQCFNAVQELSNRGLKQVNIHALLSAEKYPDCLSLIDKAETDPRLSGLNAIVFLSLKPKGRGVSLKPIKDVGAYRELVERASSGKVGIGFDSCGCGSFLASVKDHPNFAKFSVLAEKCESLLFSSYCDVAGNLWPCSFCENVETPINLLNDSPTFDEIWNGEIVNAWRTKLLNNCRNCPVYDI